MPVCINCSTQTDTDFCPNCGVSQHIHRIDKHYIAHELKHVLFHVEKGFLYTLKELTLRPGYIIHEYVRGNRSKIYKPISFLIICSVIYTLVNHYLGPKTVISAQQGNVALVFKWITDHYSYSNLIETFFLAFGLSLFFRKQPYNYFENLVLVSYINGYLMFLGAVLILLGYVTGIKSVNSIFLLLGILYTVWGITRFYKQSAVFIYIKVFIAYLFGFILLILAATAVGNILDAMHYHAPTAH